MKASFKKSVYGPLDEAEGAIEIDNSNCSAKVTKVTFAIEQEIKQKIG